MRPLRLVRLGPSGKREGSVKAAQFGRGRSLIAAAGCAPGRRGRAALTKTAVAGPQLRQDRAPRAGKRFPLLLAAQRARGARSRSVQSFFVRGAREDSARRACAISTLRPGECCHVRGMGSVSTVQLHGRSLCPHQRERLLVEAGPARRSAADFGQALARLTPTAEPDVLGRQGQPRLLL